MSSDSLVSVCVPVYNGERFLQPTLNSLASQDYRELEIILLDNASTDGSLAILERFKQEHPELRVQLHRNERLLPLPANWNRALELGRGEYLKLLPCDDVLASGCISLQAGVLRDHPKVGFTMCGKTLIGPRGKKVMDLKPGYLGVCQPPASAKDWLKTGRNAFGEPGAILFRRSTYEAVGPYDEQHVFLLDYDLHLRMARYGAFHGSPEPMVHFRLHGWSGTSHNKDRTVREFRDLVNKHALGEFTSAEINGILKRVVMYDRLRSIITLFAMQFR